MSVPSVKVWKFADPTTVDEGIEVLDQDVITLANKPFSAKRVLVGLENSMLVSHKTSHRLKTHTKVAPNLMAFLTIGPKARGTIDGLSMQPDSLISVAPGAAADLVVEPGYSSITFLISPEGLGKHLAARGRGSEFRVPNGYEFIRTGRPGIRALFELGRKITATAERQPQVFNESNSARMGANVEILETLLSVLDAGSTANSQIGTRERTRSKYAQIVKAAEAYSLADVDRRLYVSDLCHVAGVSERTLQGAFQEIMHMTPIAYLNRLKLHRARTSLRQASPSGTTVSEISLTWGFWHFGEFSQAYKKCFQELPSETLRRRSDQT